MKLLLHVINIQRINKDYSWKKFDIFDIIFRACRPASVDVVYGRCALMSNHVNALEHFVMGLAIQDRNF